VAPSQRTTTGHVHDEGCTNVVLEIFTHHSCLLIKDDDDTTFTIPAQPMKCIRRDLMRRIRVTSMADMLYSGKHLDLDEYE
jgi:hypothetical protein